MRTRNARLRFSGRTFRRSSNDMYVLFDIGGTKTRVAISRDLSKIDAVEKFDTSAAYNEGIAAIGAAVRKLLGDMRPRGAAGGIRGRLMDGRAGLLKDDVLVDWQEKPLAKDLEHMLGVPVMLENDAALAGLGEAHFGAGKGYQIVAYHTVSTGVGGVRIVNGKIDVYRSGFEPGHQIIDFDRTMCPECESGELEDIVSGTAVERRFGKKPYEIPQADPLWDQLARTLAHGLKNTIVYWSPDVIVLGGSMIVGDPRIPREAIVRHTEELIDGLVPLPPIVDAQFRDEGGLYGALALIKETDERSIGSNRGV